MCISKGKTVRQKYFGTFKIPHCNFLKGESSRVRWWLLHMLQENNPQEVALNYCKLFLCYALRMIRLRHRFTEYCTLNVQIRAHDN